MKSVHFEYGDLVMYCSGNRPHIGKYVRKESGKFIIVPEKKDGAITRRKPEDVVKLALVYKNYKEDLQKQTWSLQ